MKFRLFKSPPEGEERKVIPLSEARESGRQAGFGEMVRAFLREFWQSFVLLGVHFQRFLKACWERFTQTYLLRIHKGDVILVPSSMPRRFGLGIEALFWRAFRHMTMPTADVERIRQHVNGGHLVYVMYCRSTIDYVFFNQFFRHVDLPRAHFANGIDLTFLLPVWRMIDVLLARFVYRRKVGPIPDPLAESPSLGRAFVDQVRARKPALIFLAREKSVFSKMLGFGEDPVTKLIALQETLQTPIYLVPQLVVWRQAPGTLRERTLFDDIFGNPDKPSPLRKVIHFLRYYRRAEVKFGQALNLREYLQGSGEKRNTQEQSKQVRWLLRHYLYRERKGMLGPMDRPRSHVLNRILRHQDVKQAVDAWAARTGQSTAEGFRLARKYAQELVPDRRWAVIVLMLKVLQWVWKTIYDGVVVEEAQLEQVRKAIKDHPVVYVPNHRSHIDYLVVSCVLLQNQLVMPFICAGLNLNFWPVGPMFRRAGAYFIRRSFPDPDLYPAVLSRYVRELLAQGSAQMFFIEGGRSRTGKMLQPKLGILTKIVEGFQHGVAKDVVFVPIAVGYDRILEERSFLEEMSGGEKARENLGGVLRVVRRLVRTRYGKIYVHFGEPLSLAEYVREHTAPRWVERLAGRICYGINRVSVVYPTALIALVLLSHPKRSLSRVEISQRAQGLIRYLEHRKVRFSDVFFNREYAIEHALRQLLNAGLVQDLREGEFVFYAIPENKRLLLNFYKNNVIHFFVTFALLATVLLACARRKGEKEEVAFGEVERGYEFLLGLLEKEFFFRPKESRLAYIRDVLEFFAMQGDVEMQGNRIRLTPSGFKNLACHREIIYPTLESYGLWLQALQRAKGRMVEEREFLKEIAALGRRLFAQGRIERQESLSKFTLQNGALFFLEKGFLIEEPGKGGKRKREWRVTDRDEVFQMWMEPYHEWVQEEVH